MPGVFAPARTPFSRFEFERKAERRFLRSQAAPPRPPEPPSSLLIMEMTVPKAPGKALLSFTMFVSIQAQSRASFVSASMPPKKREMVCASKGCSAIGGGKRVSVCSCI